jgi:hypothetical protein
MCGRDRPAGDLARPAAPFVWLFVSLFGVLLAHVVAVV